MKEDVQWSYSMKSSLVTGEEREGRRLKEAQRGFEFWKPQVLASPGFFFFSNRLDIRTPTV